MYVSPSLSIHLYIYMHACIVMLCYVMLCYIDITFTAIPKVTNGTFADMQIGITDGS